MPFALFILAIGLFAGGYLALKVLRHADTKKLARLLSRLGIGIAIIAIILLIVTQKLHFAAGLLGIVLALISSWLRGKVGPEEAAKKSLESGRGLSRPEALEILGLEDGADEEQIRQAYHRLMKQAHPDQGGSEWYAKRLNEAKRRLLG